MPPEDPNQWRPFFFMCMFPKCCESFLFALNCDSFLLSKTFCLCFQLFFFGFGPVGVNDIHRIREPGGEKRRWEKENNFLWCLAREQNKTIDKFIGWRSRKAAYVGCTTPCAERFFFRWFLLNCQLTPSPSLSPAFVQNLWAHQL